MASGRARVLICEDDKDVADSLARVLRLSDYEVMMCLDGRSAIAEVPRWRPHAAVIDTGLPGMTGYAVARHIRGQSFGAEVLLIALAGHGDVADVEMARAAGFNWHFVKPVPADLILDVLENPKRLPIALRDGVPLYPSYGRSRPPD